MALDDFDAAALERRLAAIRDYGVPNYFGEQRFGRRYTDNAARLLEGRRLPRLQRSMTLSAIRSELFNRVLEERVRRGDWDQALPGEYLNLDGARGGFAALDDDPAIPGRVARLDVHPTGPLPGRGANAAGGEAARLEEEILRAFASWRELLARQGLELERRATRCRVRELTWQLDAGASRLWLDFSLRRGEFATTVLREVLHYRDVTRDERGDPDDGT